MPSLGSGRSGRRFRRWMRSTPTSRLFGVAASVLLLIAVVGVVVGIAH